MTFFIPVHAAITVTDGFESYPVGGLNGLGGGTGFVGAWTADDTVAAVANVATPLDYNIPDGGVIAGGTRALSLTGNDDFAASRIFDTSGPTVLLEGTVYVGILFRAEAGTVIGLNHFLGVYLGNGTSDEGASFGIKGNNGNGSGPLDFYGRLRFGSDQYSTDIVVGQTYYVVAKISKTSGVNYNQIETYINPTQGGEASPSTISTVATGFVNSIDRIRIRTVNFNGSDDITLGGITVGTEWTDVVPVPEPTGSLYLVAAGLLFAGRRRRE